MAVTLTETEYESGKFYLCQMFGEGSRFVDFTNLTGRYLRLSGRLELTQLSHMAWTTAVTLAPRATHVWRFLGGQHGEGEADVTSTLSLLPDPYILARENTFTWSAEFVDRTEEEAGLAFDLAPGPLRLRSLPELGPDQRLGVAIRRRGCAVSPLRKLAADTLVTEGVVTTEEQVRKLNVPRILQRELLIILGAFQEIQKKNIEKCERCSEIHHHL